MQIKEFPLMHKFMHGAFSANSGGEYHITGENPCRILPLPGDPEYDHTNPVDVRDQWNEAEKWLSDFAGWCDGMPMALRFIFWLGMEADSAVTIYVQDLETDKQVKAPPYKLLDLYY